MAEHTECISMEILRREAEDTLDPDDPMIDMYSSKKAAGKEDAKKNEKEAKKQNNDRVLINTELAQGLDEGGRFVPYDDDFVPIDV